MHLLGRRIQTDPSHDRTLPQRRGFASECEQIELHPSFKTPHLFFEPHLLDLPNVVNRLPNYFEVFANTDS